MTSRLLVVDDHPVVRDGLRGMLGTQPDLEVCGEAAGGAEALTLVAALRPDLVLTDLRMPGPSGGALIRLLLERVRPRSAPVAVLSAREREVLALIAEGRTNREAAAALFLSEATVKTHLLHIYAKLKVPDRASAVAAAHRRGLLPFDGA